MIVGNYDDDPMGEFKFSITIRVLGLTEALDKAADIEIIDLYSEEEYEARREPVEKEFYEWARIGVLDSWQTKGIQRSHQSLCKGPFGIYASPLWGITPYELEQEIKDDVMHWLAGDKLV